jgi:hypothetical protein
VLVVRGGLGGGRTFLLGAGSPGEERHGDGDGDGEDGNHEATAAAHRSLLLRTERLVEETADLTASSPP